MSSSSGSSTNGELPLGLFVGVFFAAFVIFLFAIYLYRRWVFLSTYGSQLRGRKPTLSEILDGVPLEVTRERTRLRRRPYVRGSKTKIAIMELVNELNLPQNNHPQQTGITPMRSNGSRPFQPTSTTTGETITTTTSTQSHSANQSVFGRIMARWRNANTNPQPANPPSSTDDSHTVIDV